jgi:L-threonylcarbamoyladenylate synthase
MRPMRERFNTEVLAAQTPAQRRGAVERAAALLRQGEIVALPTETVYGLAANALDPAAVGRIYRAKGRPSANPIIVHVASERMARQCVRAWPAGARKLAAAFWPGPLTLVLPRAALIPDIVTAGGDTVGIRWPAHPLMLAVIRACGFPLAAPSANLSNRISPTRAQHVETSLAGRIPLIVDGGPSEVGIESTVLDLTQRPPRVLRPGMIHEESLLAALGVAGPRPATPAPAAEGALRSPGLMRQHYAPRARLGVLSWMDGPALRRHLRRLRVAPPRCHILAHTHPPSTEGLAGVSLMPREPGAFARALYAELHRADETGVEWIIVETPPAHPAWRGIADRLNRAQTQT